MMDDAINEDDNLFKQADKAERAGQMELAGSLWRQCLERWPNAHDTRIRYGLWLCRRDEDAEALQIFASALADCQLTIEEEADVFTFIGRCHHELNQFAEAERAYRQSLALRSDANVYVLLSAVLFHSDDGKIECLQRAIELDPEQDEAHFNLGYAYERKRQFELAETHLRRAIELGYEEARAYAELGWVLMRRERHARAEAKQMLDKAVALDPKYGWARIYLANFFWQDKHHDQAEEQYQAALAIWPDDSLTHWCYGDFLSCTRRNTQRAGELLRRAVELDEEDQVAYYHLARHLWRCRHRHKARAAMQRAAELGYPKAQQLLDKWQTG